MNQIGMLLRHQIVGQQLEEIIILLFWEVYQLIPKTGIQQHCQRILFRVGLIIQLRIMVLS